MSLAGSCLSIYPALFGEKFPSGEDMSLSIGIVGLPNVGKSTLFNALTKAQNAQAANYPFCTIEPNKATVTVPDARVDALTAKAKPKKTIYAFVDFIDIAGLVEGEQGEGTGAASSWPTSASAPPSSSGALLRGRNITRGRLHRSAARHLDH